MWLFSVIFSFIMLFFTIALSILNIILDIKNRRHDKIMEQKEKDTCELLDRLSDEMLTNYYDGKKQMEEKRAREKGDKGEKDFKQYSGMTKEQFDFGMKLLTDWKDWETKEKEEKNGK